MHNQDPSPESRSSQLQYFSLPTASRVNSPVLEPLNPRLQLDYSPTDHHSELRRHDLKATCTEKRVPRPRNAFMLFRSAFWKEQRIKRSVEHDHRHISRIVGHYWNKMSTEEKNYWHRKADEEKAEHEMKHPGYRFCPTARTKKPVKRRVKRNGADDLRRCQQVAELLLSGKQGDDLEEAVESLNVEGGHLDPSTNPASANNNESPDRRAWDLDHPTFRSSFLPPSILTDPIPQPSISSAGSSPVVCVCQDDVSL